MAKTCRFTTFQCSQPHLKCCDVCPVSREYKDATKDALVAPTGLPLPTPKIKPYVKFTTPTGRPGVEFGIEGTF